MFLSYELNVILAWVYVFVWTISNERLILPIMWRTATASKPSFWRKKRCSLDHFNQRMSIRCLQSNFGVISIISSFLVGQTNMMWNKSACLAVAFCVCNSICVCTWEHFCMERNSQSVNHFKWTYGRLTWSQPIRASS